MAIGTRSGPDVPLSPLEANKAYMRVRSYLFGLCIPLLSCGAIPAEDKQIPREEPQKLGVLPVRFGGYDINRTGEKVNFMITIVNRKNASWFLQIGDRVPDTKYIIQAFVQKTVPGEREGRNVPALILTDSETGAQVILLMNIVKEVPLSPNEKQQ